MLSTHSAHVVHKRTLKNMYIVHVWHGMVWYEIGTKIILPTCIIRNSPLRGLLGMIVAAEIANILLYDMSLAQGCRISFSMNCS